MSEDEISSHPPCCPQRNGEGQSRLSGSELISRISLVSEPWFIRLLGEEMHSRQREVEWSWEGKMIREFYSDISSVDISFSTTCLPFMSILAKQILPNRFNLTSCKSNPTLHSLATKIKHCYFVRMRLVNVNKMPGKFPKEFEV